MKDSISKVCFTDGFIAIQTANGEKKALPLEVFPALYYADERQRNDYYLWAGNRSIRWDGLDEDIHISHFYEDEHVNPNNEVNKLLSKFPYIDLKSFADYIGIHWTLLARMKFGVVSASSEMLNRIKCGIRSLGEEMIQIT